MTLDDTYEQIDRARRGHRPRRRGRRGRRRHAGRHRRADRRGARARRAADLLPRARRHALHGDVGDLHRRALRAGRPRRTSPIPADADGELGGYPQLSASSSSTADPDFIFLADTECCGQDAGDRRRPARVRRPHRRQRRVGSSSSPTTSPRAGARGSSTSCGAIVEATAEVPVGLIGRRRRARPGHRRTGPAGALRACGSGGWLAGVAAVVGRRGGRPRRSARSASRPARSSRELLVVRHRPHRRPAGDPLGDPAAAGRARAARRRRRSPSAGASYQGVFRNPLADPYLLGAAAGAGLGATVVIVGDRRGAATARSPRRWPRSSARSVAVAAHLRARRRRRRRAASTASLILAGVAVAIVPHRRPDLRAAAQPGHDPRRSTPGSSVGSRPPGGARSR